MVQNFGFLGKPKNFSVNYFSFPENGGLFLIFEPGMIVFCAFRQLTDTCLSVTIIAQPNTTEGGRIMNWYATVWFILMVGFLIVEGACPFHLVSMWFAAGALVAGIVALLNGALWLQITVFLLVSCVLLAALFPLVKKFLRPNIEKTNVDAVIGSRGYVTEDIDNIDAVGQVKLGGMYWTARAANGEKIPAGTLVEVDHIEGVKAFVSPVKTPVKEEVNL